ncbi:MAG: hypothetical protein Q8R07_00720 [Candidatus Uhrbacteria bacterium]|nr:hypothetical protein [Candidatus Uhrbacteria bacterium]
MDCITVASIAALLGVLLASSQLMKRYSIASLAPLEAVFATNAFAVSGLFATGVTTPRDVFLTDTVMMHRRLTTIITVTRGGNGCRAESCHDFRWTFSSHDRARHHVT